MNYRTTIGLEIHAQLSTHSKIFCGCTTDFGGEANTHGCQVCLGMPGVLPVCNKTVVDYAIHLGIVCGCDFSPVMRFARKNYFYPDLPKGYQISQFELPVCSGGHIDIETKNGQRCINLTRIHLEEDAGKLVHIEGEPNSYFDVNRCGVPLIEIVTEPDFINGEEVRTFLVKIRETLIYLGISKGNMEEGNLRVDTNISIRPEGTNELGVKTEIKNLNSITNTVNALTAERKRQIDIIENDGTITQDTLLWDADRNRLVTMRTKEYAHDYRYFPEPDLVPFEVKKEWIESIRESLPEMPDAKRERFISDYGIPEYDAGVLTDSKATADYFESVVKAGVEAKMASNWIMCEVLRVLHDRRIEAGEFPVTPERFAGLLKLLISGGISGSAAKEVFEEMLDCDDNPQVIVDRKGLEQKSDRGEIEPLVKEVLAENPEEVESYKNGKTKLLGFFIGQIMKKSKQANPKLVCELLKEILS